MQNKKQAFTLVELIVVITILAILGTIAFISLQGYSKQARDSARINDMSKIKSSLELFYLDANKYAKTTGGIEITYSGTEAWTQGIFGNNTFDNVEKLDQIPLDPLTLKEYTYSTTNTRQEYQIAQILEGDDYVFISPQLFPSNGEKIAIISQANAGEKLAILKITGNYNGEILKVNKGTTTYVLAVPSIITSTGGTLLDIITNKHLAYNGYKNLPFGYNNSSYNTLGDSGITLVNSGNLVVYSGSISDLTNPDGSTARQTLIVNLQKAYSGTTIATKGGIKELVNIDTSNTGEVELLASSKINNTLGGKLKLVNITSNGSSSSGAPFISTWNVGIDTGVSGLNNLKLPLKSNGTYNFTVDWGDGSAIDTITSYDQAEATHSYAGAGLYDVTITGQIDGFAFDGFADNADDGDKLIDIKQWGSLKLSNGGRQFAWTDNIVSFSAIDNPNLVGITDLNNMFTRATSFNGDISGWDVSGVTNMSYMFYYASAFNQNISAWNVSSVTNMSNMFNYALAFNQDISAWDVSSVTNMAYMFRYADVFNQPLNSWNVASVTNMYDMFSYASAFNQALNSWNVSSVTNMSGMFAYASAFNQALNSWNVSSVTNMSSMFNYASNFNQDISTWNVANVTNMSSMFGYVSNFNQDISTWDVANVIAMGNMFAYASAFNQDISSWDVSGVTNMSYMFYYASTFNQNIGVWNVASVTNMGYMFAYASAFNQPLNSWNVSNVTNFSTMLLSATNFNQPLNLWDVSSATNMSNMFRSATSFNQDISAWNVANVTTMFRIFYSASTFNQNLGGWNVTNVTNYNQFDTNATSWVLAKPSFL